LDAGAPGSYNGLVSGPHGGRGGTSEGRAVGRAMVKIRQEQIRTLREAATAQQLAEAAEYVYRKIGELAPEVVSGYSHDDAIALIIKVFEVTSKYGIRDTADVAQWSYLRLLAKEDFYDRPAFKYFLDDPLIHPARKGQGVVEAYILAAELEAQ
jgi:hypothetical protein